MCSSARGNPDEGVAVSIDRYERQVLVDFFFQNFFDKQVVEKKKKKIKNKKIKDFFFLFSKLSRELNTLTRH